MFIFDLLQRVWKMDGMDEMMMVLLSRCFFPLKVTLIRAGRYDQQFISRYFSKLYRFHGI